MFSGILICYHALYSSIKSFHYKKVKKPLELHIFGAFGVYLSCNTSVTYSIYTSEWYKDDCTSLNYPMLKCSDCLGHSKGTSMSWNAPTGAKSMFVNPLPPPPPFQKSCINLYATGFTHFSWLKSAAGTTKYVFIIIHLYLLSNTNPKQIW